MKNKIKEVIYLSNELNQIAKELKNAIGELENEINNHINITKNIIIKIKEIRKSEREEK